MLKLHPAPRKLSRCLTPIRPPPAQDYAETKFKAERGGKAEELLLPKLHSGGGTVVLREMGAR
jgi:hypothetical protein